MGWKQDDQNAESLRKIERHLDLIEKSLEKIAEFPPYTLKPSHEVEIVSVYGTLECCTQYKGSCCKCRKKTDWLSSTGEVMDYFKETDCIEENI